MESFGADGPPGAYVDFDETECIVLVGHSAAEQSTVLRMRILAAKAGPKKPRIIVIDPRRTFSVDTGADLHLQLRPGTNVALLNGICHLLIANEWIDREYIARRTVYYDDFARTVSTYTPERVESITGVPADQLRLAAESIGRSKSTVTTCLQGVYQANQGTLAACTVNSMHLLMGKIGRPGSAPMQFAGQPSAMSTRETGAIGSYPAYRNWDDPSHMRDFAQLWNVPVELLGKKPVSAPEIFELCEKGYVKVLRNICTNPAVSMTDWRTQLDTLRGTFLVVQDCFADTETALLTDVVLPSAMWREKAGCMTNAERRVNSVAKVVDPPGEARSDFDIFVDFSRCMGLVDKDGERLLGFTTPEEAFDEWREVSRGTIPDYSGMTYARLHRHPLGGRRAPGSRRWGFGTARLAPWNRGRARESRRGDDTRRRVRSLPLRRAWRRHRGERPDAQDVGSGVEAADPEVRRRATGARCRGVRSVVAGRRDADWRHDAQRRRARCTMTPARRSSTDGDALAALLEPLAAREIASIGAIEAAAP